MILRCPLCKEEMNILNTRTYQEEPDKIEIKARCIECETYVTMETPKKHDLDGLTIEIKD